MRPPADAPVNRRTRRQRCNSRPRWWKGELIGEVDAERRGKAGKAAEGHTIEQHEPPGICILERMQIGAQRLGTGLVGRILCNDHVNYEQDRVRYDGENHHYVPYYQFTYDRLYQ